MEKEYEIFDAILKAQENGYIKFDPKTFTVKHMIIRRGDYVIDVYGHTKEEPQKIRQIRVRRTNNKYNFEVIR